MKQDNGIGYIKLIIGVIIVTIIAIFAVLYIKEEIRKENVKEIQADLLLVQGKVELIGKSHGMNSEANPLKGYQLTVLPEGLNLQEFFEKNVIAQEEYEKYYVLDDTILQEIGLEQLVGKYDSYFIVNYENYEIIFSKGYENIYGLWCYKISDLYKTPEVNAPLEQNISVDGNNVTSENADTATEGNAEVQQ